MLVKLINFLLNTDSGKITGAATVGTGSLLTLIFSLHSSAINRIDSEIQKSKYEIVKAVDSKFIDNDKLVTVELHNLNKKQDETNKMVRDLYNHLLNKRRD